MYYSEGLVCTTVRVSLYYSEGLVCTTVRGQFVLQ